ncbi:transporter substrate-binding domain-containing protein [Rheinheimera sp.]|uniref:substrate-binding periplasmic protein n=1 Tax=Rheinheimera sp. TaxID=1869214 RepID=UPI00307D519A
MKRRAALLLGACGLWVQAADFIAVTESMPPMQQEQDGVLSGENVDRVRAVLKQAGLSAEFRLYPWARAYNMAQRQSKVLIFALARTPAREAKFHWIGKLVEFRLGLVRLKQRGSPLNSLEQLKHKTIAVQREDSAYQWLVQAGFAEGKQLMVAANSEQSWWLLANGKVDYVLENPLFLPEIERRNQLPPGSLVFDWAIPELSASAYLAASLGTPPELVQRLQQAYGQLKE